MRARTGKVEKPEEGCAACGREKLRNRRKAVRRADGKSGETGERLCARGWGKWTTASGREENSS